MQVLFARHGGIVLVQGSHQAGVDSCWPLRSRAVPKTSENETKGSDSAGHRVATRRQTYIHLWCAYHRLWGDDISASRPCSTRNTSRRAGAPSAPSVLQASPLITRNVCSATQPPRDSRPSIAHVEASAMDRGHKRLDTAGCSWRSGRSSSNSSSRSGSA